jgi:hypothetical protein
LGPHGQPDLNDRLVAGGGLNLQIATMRVDDPPAYRQPQATSRWSSCDPVRRSSIGVCAGRIYTIEPLAYMGQVLGWNARTVVSHTNQVSIDATPVLGFHVNTDASSDAGAMLQRVLNDIRDQLSQVRSIPADQCFG